MSAYRSCMCLLTKSRLYKTSNVCFRQCNNLGSSQRLRLFERACSPWQSSLVWYYSTQKGGSSVKGLSDEIHDKNNDNKQQNEENKSESKDNKSESKDKKSSFWSKVTGKNAWKIGLAFLGTYLVFGGGVLIAVWGPPPVDPEGHYLKDEYSELPAVQAYIIRTMKELDQFTQKIQDPSREKLLPDPLEYPYLQPPYTLAIEMTGVLVHPDWTYGTGWRFKKRKGIDYFLQKIGPPLFEVVIFTSEQGFTADAIVNNLDPHGYIMYRLYRDSTKYTNGHHIKDLSCLNRDLSKVIMLDCNSKSVDLQRRNAFVIKKWSGSDDDRELYDLANFLHTLASSGVEDVRSVMDYYLQFDDPIGAFKENQKKLQEEQEKQTRQSLDQNKPSSRLNFLSSWRR